jgi:hypothetical protein
MRTRVFHPWRDWIVLSIVKPSVKTLGYYQAFQSALLGRRFGNRRSLLYGWRWRRVGTIDPNRPGWATTAAWLS